MSLPCGSLQCPRDISQPYTTYFTAHGPTGSAGQDQHRVSVTVYKLYKTAITKPVPQERNNTKPSLPISNQTSSFHFTLNILSKMFLKAAVEVIQVPLICSPKGFRKKI